MSQINQFLQRIAAIEVGISVPNLPIPYILQAEPYQPSDMSSVSCPFWINELDPAGGRSDIPIAAGQQYRETLVSAMLCVQRREADIDLKYGVSNTANWVDAAYAAFAQHVRLSAPTINMLSSTNANPIQITTAIPHGFVNGNQVTIANHQTNTNANGTWNVTVIDNWNFTVPVAGNGVGAATGTARLTQPFDLGNIIDAVIVGWSLIDYVYGSSEFLAIRFVIRVREMYVTQISQ